MRISLPRLPVRTRRFAPVLALAGLLLLPACMESDEGVKLAADGSGTIEATYTSDLAKARELLDYGKMMMDPSQTDGISIERNDPFHPAWFRSAAKGVEGFRIDSAERTATKTHRTTKVKATFASLQAAAKGGAFFNAIVILEEVVWPEPKPSDAAPATGTPAAPEAKPNAWKLTMRPVVASEYNGMSVQEILLGFESTLSGMKLTRRVSVPSKILHSNVKIAEDGRSVTQQVDFKVLTTAKSLATEVVFEKVDGLKLKAFKHMPNMESMLPRFQNPAPKEAVVTPSATEGAGEESTPEAAPDGGAGAKPDPKKEAAPSGAGG